VLKAWKAPKIIYVQRKGSKLKVVYWTLAYLTPYTFGRVLRNSNKYIKTTRTWMSLCCSHAFRLLRLYKLQSVPHLCIMYSCTNRVRKILVLRRSKEQNCKFLLTCSWRVDVGTAQAGSMFIPASNAATDQLSSVLLWTNTMTHGGSYVQRCLLKTYVKGAFRKVHKSSVFLSFGL
jgi:hypothetical protein